jgi:hypothetical protein
MDTNLYDFLRTIHAHVAHPSKGHEYDPRHQIKITKAEFDWLNSFLRNPGTLIEFRSRPTGRMLSYLPPPRPFTIEEAAPSSIEAVEEPEMEHHYALAGTAEEVFELLYQAMVLNPTFAQIALSAGRAYTAKAPLCRRCGQRHHGRLSSDCPDIVSPRWEFKHRPL